DLKWIARLPESGRVVSPGPKRGRVADLAIVEPVAVEGSIAPADPEDRPHLPILPSVGDDVAFARPRVAEVAHRPPAVWTVRKIVKGAEEFLWKIRLRRESIDELDPLSRRVFQPRHAVFVVHPA